MRATKRMLVAFATVALLGAVMVTGTPTAGAADSSTTVALFFDNTYTPTGAGNADNEGWALQQYLISLGVQIQLITGIADTDFSTGLDGANVLVIPELENSDQLGPDMSAAARQVVTDWVAGGGRIVFVGSTDPSPTINALFGFSVAGTIDSVCELPDVCPTNAEATGTEFEGMDPLEYQDDVTGLVISTLPAGSISPFDNPADTTLAPVAVMPYGDGSVAYSGYDWFDGPPEGTQTGDGWTTLMDAIITPLAVDFGTSVGGAAGDTISCPIDVGPGSQRVAVSWEGTFASSGDVFTGSFVLSANETTTIDGYSTRPEGDTASVVITVDSPFGQVVNDTCMFTWTGTPTTTAAPAPAPLPVTPVVAAPVAVTPAFTG